MTVMILQNFNTMFLHNGIVLKDSISERKARDSKWDMGYFYGEASLESKTGTF